MTTPSTTIIARCLGVASILGCLTAADAQVFYSAKQIGGAGAQGYGVNNRGQVVGMNAGGQAFVTGANGVGVTVLAPPAGQSNQAIAINNRGQVLVTPYSRFGPPTSGYITGPNAIGKYTLSPLPGGNFLDLRGLNSIGQVVGTSGYISVSTSDQTPTFQDAFITGPNGSGVRRIATMPGWTSVEASGINDNGQITGSYYLQASGQYLPFITGSNGAGAREINSPSIIDRGGFFSGDRINAHGQVLVSWYSGAFAGQEAFLTDANGSGEVDLGSLSCCGLTFASGLNNWGQVVGEADPLFDGPGSAFVSSQGAMKDLSSLIDPASPLPSGTVLTGATAISNTGKIVATGLSGTGSAAATSTWLLTPCAKSGACGGNIFWRNVDGHLITWYVSGGGVVSTADLGNPGAQWSVAGTGDLIGTGDLDIVWTDKSGNVMVWYVTGGVLRSSVSLGKVSITRLQRREYHYDEPRGTNQRAGVAAVEDDAANDGEQPEENDRWTVAGVADFNGDGRNDMLWRNKRGVLEAWYMRGKTHSSSANIGTVPPTWTIEAVGDVNGDGIGDIICRNNRGDTQVWLMTATSLRSIHDLGVAPTDWKLSGVADFDGDGRADILWRDASSGRTLIWFLNGGAISTSANVRSLPIGWSVAATGDFDGNGNHDILWRNVGGDTVLWDMNGIHISSSSNLINMPNGQWSIVR